MRTGTASAVAVCASLALAAPAHAQLPVELGGGEQPPAWSPYQEPPPREDPSEKPQRRKPKPTPKPSWRRLSNERTLSRWAYAFERAKVRRRPNGNARSITRLRYDTEDGYPEVYLALRRYRSARGRVWVQVRLPMRPNGRTGWVRREALGRFHVVRTRLVVDRRRLRATLYRSGRRVWRAPVGVGRRGMETPRGRFYVRERMRVAQKDSLYGPLAFGTSAYSKLSDWPGGGVIGIHGTNEPWLVPGRPSHGCIRLRNRAIRRLGRLMPIGTPIRIR